MRAAERADFADHAARNSGGERPAQGDQLEGGSVACAQCGEAEHEEQRGGEQRRGGHQAKESGDGDEKDDGECGDAADAVSEPATEDACGRCR